MENTRNTSCPECRSKLTFSNEMIRCNQCNAEYSIKDNIELLIPNSHDSGNYIDHYIKDAELFDYFAERECGATEHDERRLREYVLSLLPKGNTNILDCGSGSAWMAKALQKNNKSLTTFDISFKNVKTALDKYPFNNHTGVVGDALNPPFADNSFDCVVSSEVIEHVPDPGLFVTKLFSLVKPGGSLIISTPYKEKIQYYLCVHCNQPTPRNAHLHSFDKDKLSSLLVSNEISSRKFFIFGNKALIMLRLHVILKFFPLGIWKMIDSLANIILPKQEHIIMQITKKEK